jgi:RNA exonuclease 1
VCIFGHDLLNASSADDTVKAIWTQVRRSQPAARKRSLDTTRTTQEEPNHKRALTSLTDQTDFPAESKATVGPPKITVGSSISRVNIQQREKALFLFYTEYLRIYAQLEDSEQRAAADALREEQAIYDRSNANTYRTNASPVLLSLKKRSIAERQEQAGVTSEYNQYLDLMSSKAPFGTNLVGVWLTFVVVTDEQVNDLLVSVEHKTQCDYPTLNVPPLIDDAATAPVTKRCDRCSTPFLPMSPSEMSKQQKEACSFHWGRLVRKQDEGENIKQFSCCGGGTIWSEPLL